MSVDPISLTVALSALILGLWNHIKYSKCFGVEIQMVTDDQPKSGYPPNAVVTKLESAPIPIPQKKPTFGRENYL